MNFVYLKVLFVDPKNLPFPFYITNHEKKMKMCWNLDNKFVFEMY